MRDADSELGWQAPARAVSTALGLFASMAFAITALGCGASDVRLATRILQEHRGATGARPSPASQRIELAISSPGSPAAGVETIEWDARNYRETFASGGLETIRGIQGGKAYYTDEDGVTRVVSEPILAELVTRSYFWRRAYLFDDAERARLALGPAGAQEVSVRATPRGGNPLLLTFARRGLQLVSVRSAGLRLDYESAARWRDSSRTRTPVEVKLRHAGLPTETLRDATIGGWSAVWPGPVSDSPLSVTPAGAVVVRGSVAGREMAVAVDSEADGPVRVRPTVASSLPLLWTVDVLGRRLATGARLALGRWTEPSVSVEATDAVPLGADAAVGAALFRESIVEYDRDGGRLRVHDPERWVRPEGYYRSVLDDDGNRPVAILHRGKETFRLLAGASGSPEIRVAPETAERLEIYEAGRAEGLRWGPAPLPDLECRRIPAEFDPGLGDDGRLSTQVLLRFRAVLDMPHRWAYLKPETGRVPRENGS